MKEYVSIFIEVDRFENPHNKKLVTDIHAEEDWKHIKVDVEASVWFIKEDGRYRIEDEQDIEYSLSSIDYDDEIILDDDIVLTDYEKRLIVEKLYDNLQ